MKKIFYKKYVLVTTLYLTVFCLGIFTSTPTLHAQTTAPLASNPGDTVIINGTGFTPENNAVQLSSLTNANIVYDIPGLTSNGTTLVFTVPADAAPGPYTLKVGAFNSAWSDGISFIITTATTSPRAPFELSLVPNAGPSGAPITILGTNFTQDAVVIVANASGTTSIHPSVASPNNITFMMPSLTTGRSTTTVFVRNNLGTSNTLLFTLSNSSSTGSTLSAASSTVAHIDTISPTIGAPGTLFVVNGSDFISGDTILLQGTTSSVSILPVTINPSTISFSAPFGTKAGVSTIVVASGKKLSNPIQVEIKPASAVNYSALPLEQAPKPWIDGVVFSPGSCSSQYELIINGHNFDQSATISASIGTFSIEAITATSIKASLACPYGGNFTQAIIPITVIDNGKVSNPVNITINGDPINNGTNGGGGLEQKFQDNPVKPGLPSSQDTQSILPVNNLLAVVFKAIASIFKK